MVLPRALHGLFSHIFSQCNHRLPQGYMLRSLTTSQVATMTDANSPLSRKGINSNFRAEEHRMFQIEDVHYVAASIPSVSSALSLTAVQSANMRAAAQN
jgi:hypothetical protein